MGGKSSKESPNFPSPYASDTFIEEFDFKIKVVTIGEDIRVKKVTNFPNACGKWQIVTNFPVLKVKEVVVGQDFKVKYVTNFQKVPGC